MNPPVLVDSNPPKAGRYLDGIYIAREISEVTHTRDVRVRCPLDF